jgi:hypothetical protein
MLGYMESVSLTMQLFISVIERTKDNKYWQKWDKRECLQTFSGDIN